MENSAKKLKISHETHFKQNLKKRIQDNFSKYFKNHNFESIDINEWDIRSFNAIVGLNGCGKTNFLKVIRETIVESLNYPLPLYVVRLLSFGRESENYDPDKRNHPFVDSTFFNNISAKLAEFAKNKLNGNDNDPLETKNWMTCVWEDFQQRLQDCNFEFTNLNGDNRDLFLQELKKFHKRLILNCLSYGSSEQLVNFYLRRTKKLAELNEYLKKKEFPYEVVPDMENITNRNPILSKTFFLYHPIKKINLRLKSISPGEKLMFFLFIIEFNSDIIDLKRCIPNGKDVQQVFLLDEPDSNCHPSLIKEMITVIKTVLVEKLNMIVIMTTHNPSTFCLLDIDDLFILEDENKFCLSEMNHLNLEQDHTLEHLFSWYWNWG